MATRYVGGSTKPLGAGLDTARISWQGNAIARWARRMGWYEAE